MLQLPPDAETLENTIDAALGISPEKCTDAQAVSGYRFTLRRSWERAVPLVGDQGARAIVEYAIRVASRRHPMASLVAVGDDGPDLPQLDAGQAGSDLPEICRGLRGVCAALFRTLTELMGEVVASPLLEDMKQHQATAADGQ